MQAEPSPTELARSLSRRERQARAKAEAEADAAQRQIAEAETGLAAVAAERARLATAQPEYLNGGAKACLDCHRTERVMGIAETGHAKRDNPNTPASLQACESCHGPSATHSRFPMQVENVHFGKKSRTPRSRSPRRERSRRDATRP